MNNLPSAFEERMKKQLGKEAEAFFQALRMPAPVSVRINPAKKREELPEPLASNIKGTVEWCPEGYFLRERPLFTLDPCYQGGAYYVQEASSMFLCYILHQITENRPLTVLDLCAAPGGKTTLLSASLPAESLLVSNEVIRNRAAILKENVIRWGSPYSVVTNNDPADFSAFPEKFDLIIVDAPCSGEGMFRKDPAAITEWNENSPGLCCERQKRILSDIWPALKPGGFLIYSTCTYNTEENEDILDWLCRNFQAESFPILHSFPDITPAYGLSAGYRFYPHKTKGEGFFCGVVRKTTGQQRQQSGYKKQKTVPAVRMPEKLAQILRNTSGWSVWNENNRLLLLPRLHEDLIRNFHTHLHVLSAGTEAAEIYNRKFRLLHPLALNQLLNPEACRTAETDLPTALRYLKKEDIRINAPDGSWVLVTYQNLPLGWGKSLKNRFNNYYPKEWRIRMDIPENMEF